MHEPAGPDVYFESCYRGIFLYSGSDLLLGCKERSLGIKAVVERHIDGDGDTVSPFLGLEVGYLGKARDVLKDDIDKIEKGVVGYRVRAEGREGGSYDGSCSIFGDRGDPTFLIEPLSQL